MEPSNSSGVPPIRCYDRETLMKMRDSYETRLEGNFLPETRILLRQFGIDSRPETLCIRTTVPSTLELSGANPSAGVPVQCYDREALIKLCDSYETRFKEVPSTLEPSGQSSMAPTNPSGVPIQCYDREALMKMRDSYKTRLEGNFLPETRILLRQFGIDIDSRPKTLWNRTTVPSSRRYMKQKIGAWVPYFGQKFVYAVARGHVPGIYMNARDFDAQMRGFFGASGRKFATMMQASNWLWSQQMQTPTPFDEPSDNANGQWERQCWPAYFSSADTRPIVFTDGSYTPVYLAEFCGVFWGLGHSDNVAARIFSVEPDNNRAECMAVIVAVAQAIQKGFGAIQIVTDALYLMEIIESKKSSNNCKKKMGRMNDLIEQLLSLMQQIDVKFVFVHGHKYAEQYEPWQVAGNRMAHALARRSYDQPSHQICSSWLSTIDGRMVCSLLPQNHFEPAPAKNETVNEKCSTSAEQRRLNVSQTMVLAVIVIVTLGTVICADVLCWLLLFES